MSSDSENEPWIIVVIILQTLINLIFGITFSIFIVISENSKSKLLLAIVILLNLIFNFSFVLLNGRSSPLNWFKENEKQDGHLKVTALFNFNNRERTQSKIILDSKSHYQEIYVEDDTVLFYLDLNSNYTVQFTNRGSPSKKILFDTKTYNFKNDTNDYNFEVNLKLQDSIKYSDSITELVAFDASKKVFIKK